MSILKNILISVVASLLVFAGAYKYLPLDWLETAGDTFGTSITTILSTDTLSASRTTINNNFSALNTGKFELSDWYATTSATQLVKVGTLTTGVWNATTITVPFGGTGSTTLSSGQVLIGNGTGNIGVVSSYGNSGQFLTSNGTGIAPTWQSASVDQTQNYTWTGNHLFKGLASSTLFAVLDTLYIGRTATSTLQGSTTGTSTLQGFLNISGTNSTSTVSGNFKVSGNSTTTTLVISNTCTGCLSGYERVTTTFNMDAGSPSTGTATLSCSAGKQILGGGASNVKNVASSRLDSYPSSNTAWTVDIIGANGENDTITVYAICAYP